MIWNAEIARLTKALEDEKESTTLLREHMAKIHQISRDIQVSHLASRALKATKSWE